MTSKEDYKLPKKLLENLEPGEVVIGAVRQRFAVEKPKWLIVTNRRVIYFDEKLLGRYELKSVPYEKLLRVYYRRGIVGSEFRLELENGEVIDLSWMSKDNAEKAIESIREALEKISVEPPTITKKKHLTSLEIILEKPKELVSRSVSRTVISDQPRAAGDPIERLEKLKKLLDEGAITPEEYERLRKRILAELGAG